MRSGEAASLALIFALLSAPAAWSQAGPLPRAFAGYAQNTVPADACRAVTAAEVRCEIPAMTAGRYLIEAAGTSSAPGAGANQAIEIDIGGRQCGGGRNASPWKSGARTFRVDCEAILLADTATSVRVVYADAQATKDPKGPIVTIRPLPWAGVLAARPFAPPQ